MRASSLWFSLMTISLLGLAVRADVDDTSLEAASIESRARKHHPHRHHHKHHHKHHKSKAHKSHKGSHKNHHQQAPAPVVAGAGSGPAPATKTPSGVEKCAPTGGMMTEYWDCCKLASAWPWLNMPTNRPSFSCAANGATILENTQAKGGCDPGGVSWACNQHQPFTDPHNPNLGYVIGARWVGHGIRNFYGACYQVEMNERPEKTLIFQALNTGEDYKYNQIDMQIPGSGAGWGEHCYTQWGNNPAAKGRNFIPMDSIEACQYIPEALQPGCRWRWEFLYGKENPKGLMLSIKSMCRVKCPKILTDKTGMIRNDDHDFPEYTAK